MKSVINNFQSYLILGTYEKRKGQLEILLNNLNLDISQNSPDLFTIETTKMSPTGKQALISIDDIRSLKKHIFQKPVSAPFKVVIIKDAQNLSQEAQNAILKILEEPPIHAVIVLEAENEFQFLPTILSRVVKIKSIADISANPKSSFLEKIAQDNLMRLQKIENPLNYLDNQIIVLYKKLLKAVETGDTKTQKNIQYAITLCLNAKKMISANVNSKFVLANLFLSVHKTP